MHDSTTSGRLARVRRSAVVAATGALLLAATAIAAASAPAQAAQPDRAATAGHCATAPAPTRVRLAGGRLAAAARPGGTAAACSGSVGTSDPAQGTPPLINHGGPVMATAGVGSKLVVTPIFWQPSGYSFTTSYKNILIQYLNDVAAASNHRSNVFATNTEYAGNNGQVHYNISVGTPITDSGEFPASGCTVDTGSIYSDGTGYSACLDDAQIISEVSADTSALPQNLGHIYVMFTPKHVESCFYPAGTSGQQCTLNYTPSAAFCAYHSAFGSTGQSIYAMMPFPIYGSGTGYTCGSEAGFPTNEAPNGDVDADVETSPLSHEISEAMTDPDLNAWADSKGYENGDECAYTYGTSHGSAGALYNQTINGHHYLTQEEFSNKNFRATGGGCIQTAPPQHPTITKVTPNAGSVSGGTSVTINGTGLDLVTKVTFGGVAGTSLKSYSSTKLTVVVPAHAAGTVSVVASSPDETSTAGSYAYGKPSISGVSPQSGTHNGGTTVTITGKSFAPGATVLFGTKAGTGVHVVSGTKLTVKAPSHVKGQVNLFVTTAAGKSTTSSAAHYRFT